MLIRVPFTPSLQDMEGAASSVEDHIDLKSTWACRVWITPFACFSKACFVITIFPSIRAIRAIRVIGASLTEWRDWWRDWRRRRFGGCLGGLCAGNAPICDHKLCAMPPPLPAAPPSRSIRFSPSCAPSALGQP
ncbi:hypothetical protein [Plasticicumulans lactativorans]|uniref:hypothetical protein n=1 Tax=Plasticicumulans lactativorans TaxID=1133106 RepID=UPI00104DB27C|nr:hypothetical protein [Plasticicumulans lactativorans]